MSAVAVIDYGMGNLRSVAGAVRHLGHDVVVTDDADRIRRAERIIIPGVGAFPDGMANLAKAGLLEVLNEAADGGRPILGICLGAQLMLEHGTEFAPTEGLGWIPGRVERLAARDLRIPHVGWNDTALPAGHWIAEGLPELPLMYYVHSYHMACEPAHRIGTCTYGEEFAAAVQKDNIVGVQFHPEKSQKAGMQLLDNFLRWTP